MKTLLWLLSPLIVVGLVFHLAARSFRCGWRLGESLVFRAKGH